MQDISVEFNLEDNEKILTNFEFNANPAKLSELENDVGFTTKQEVEAGLDTKQDKGDYALKSEIPDITPLATKEEVQEGLDTKQDKGNYLTEHQDISHLATKEELSQGLDTKQDKGDYATVDQLPEFVAGDDIIIDAPFENDEYVQVEYIEFSGNEYVDTGLTDDVYNEYSIKAYPTVGDSTTRTLFGFSKDGISNAVRIVKPAGSSPHLQIAYTDETAGNTTRYISSVSLNTWYDISSNYNNFTVDDEVKFEYTKGYTETSAKIVFAGSYSGNTLRPSFVGRISNFKVRQYGSDVISHNFVPVKSKTSDEVGYYDTIGENFVPLVNTASEKLYTVGQLYSIVKVSSDVPTYIAGNGIIFSAPFENNDYKQVEYIETSGNEYIDTGFLNGLYCIYEATFSATSIDSNYRSLFGFYSGNVSLTPANCIRVTKVNGENSLQAVCRDGNTDETLITGLGTIEENKWYTVKSSADGFYLDGQKVFSYYQSTTEFPAKIILYGTWVGYSSNPTSSDWAARPSFIGKISNFKITQYVEGIPTLKHNFISVKSKTSNQVGFYDLVTGYFAPLINTASEKLYTIGKDYDIKIETPVAIPPITDGYNQFLHTDGEDVTWQSGLRNYADNPKRNIAITDISTGDYFVSINPEISGQAGKYCVGIGHGFLPKNYSVGVGYKPTLNTYSAAVGTYSKAGQYSVAMGYSASANYSECIAVGCNASCDYNDSISIGRYAKSYRSIAIGNSANGGNSYGVALGLSAASNGTCSIAIGSSACTELSGDNGYNQIAIGNTATTNAKAAIAIGADANSNAENAIQLGTGTNSNDGSLQVYTYPLLYSDGTIPYQRLSLQSPSDGQALIYDDNLGELVWGEAGGMSEIPIATTSTLGGVIVGNGLSVDANGKISADVQDITFSNIAGSPYDNTALGDELNVLQGDIDTVQSNIDTVETNLQSQIDTLSAIGQFLAIWDCDTHTARYLTEGYQYQAGNYFIIGSIATDGGVNYMPNGSSYPNYVETTEDVKVSDMWFYDGANWIYLANHERAIAVDAELDATSINPVENKAVAKAIGDLDSLVDIKLDDINVAIEELQNRPSGVGVPQLASVENLQITEKGLMQERVTDYNNWAGLFSEIVFTLNLDKQALIEKMYDLYITTSRYKTNKNLSFEVGDGEQINYRNIPKFSVMNDLRQKTNQRIYCWRFISDSSYPTVDPKRYVYMYTRDWYADGQALRDADPEVGLWYNYETPSGYCTCLNAIGWTNGYTAETVYQDMYDTDTGIERYEDGDISEFANLKNMSQYLTTMNCRKYTKDGQNYFFWCSDWSDEAAWVFVSSDGDDNILPNSIPKHMDTLNNLYNVANILSIYTFVENRPDLNYKLISDRDAFLNALEEETFKGVSFEYNKPQMWECYWHDYPVMPVLLKDCQVRLHNSNADGRWHKFEDVVNTPELLERLDDEIPLVFKLPYNTYYYWMRFLAVQKRCCYGNPTDWMEESGRTIANPMYPYQKNSLMEGIWNGNIFSKKAYGRKRSSYRNNSGYGKITECLQFNVCSPRNVSSGTTSSATPIQKKLVISNSGKTALRD